MHVVYDVAHNIAKIERHSVDGREVELCVHRKGATRAFPAGHPDVPARYRDIGQPVLIPGDMGRYSFLAVGQPAAMHETWGSTCHGAGRVRSRHEAKRVLKGVDVGEAAGGPRHRRAVPQPRRAGRGGERGVQRRGERRRRAGARRHLAKRGEDAADRRDQGMKRGAAGTAHSRTAQTLHPNLRRRAAEV